MLQKRIVFIVVIATLTSFLPNTKGRSILSNRRKINAEDFPISASSTCGNGESFNGRSCAGQTFAPELAVDGDESTAWVSGIFRVANASLTYTIKLEQEYFLSSLRYIPQPKTRDTPNIPFNWELQTSLDGVTYRTLVVFVTSSLDCPEGSFFSRNISHSSVDLIMDDQVLCSDDPYNLVDFTSGLSIPLLDNRMGATELATNVELMSFLKASYVRLYFEYKVPSELLDLPPNRVAISELQLFAICNCNGFATSCPEDLITGQYSCECQGNTCGQSCERCCPLYNNFPYEVNTTGSALPCEACECNNHASKCYYDLVSNSGVCEDCEDGTRGDQCEICRNEFYRPEGSDLKEPCNPCNCNRANSKGPQCNREGICSCLDGFSGDKCDECKDELVYNRFTKTCEECGCYPEGTELCINETCDCKASFSGELCDSCQSGYYNYPNCIACGCPSPDGSNLGTCDAITGDCLDCPAHRTGPKCEMCQEGFWGTERNLPCQPCGCSDNSLNVAQCNVRTGNCNCKEGYNGRTCEMNEDEYYGYPEAIPCNCDKLGSVNNTCNKITGECTCLTGAIGSKCDMCVNGTLPNYLGGCAECECSPLGANSTICDARGQCACKVGVTGQYCDSCKVGFWDLSSSGCKMCYCNENGSNPNSICDMHTGECICTAAVTGETCDSCNITRIHIMTKEGCEICGDCVDPLINTALSLNFLLNETILLLPNLTIRIGPNDLNYIKGNISSIDDFLDIWDTDVITTEIALGIKTGTPPDDGSFVLFIVPNLQEKFELLNALVNDSFEFKGLDDYGILVSLLTNSTFQFSVYLEDSFMSVNEELTEVNSFLTYQLGSLRDYATEISNKRTDTDRELNIIIKRDFVGVDKTVTSSLDVSKLKFEESSRLKSNANGDHGLARMAVEDINAVIQPLRNSNNWVADTVSRSRNADMEYNQAFTHNLDIERDFPGVNKTSQETLEELLKTISVIELAEMELNNGSQQFNMSMEIYSQGELRVERHSAKVLDYRIRLYENAPSPINASFEGELHAEMLDKDARRIESDSLALRRKARMFLDELPAIPNIGFSSLDILLNSARQQADSANATLRRTDLPDLSFTVDTVNTSATVIFEDSETALQKSSDAVNLTEALFVRYSSFNADSVKQNGRLDLVLKGIEELEAKSDFAPNFTAINETTLESERTFNGINRTSVGVAGAIPQVQSDIHISRKNTGEIKTIMKEVEFILGCISDQAKEINESLSGIDSEIDSLLDGADELMTEIDDLINSLAPVHNGISINAQVGFEHTAEEENPYISLQPPPRFIPGIPVQSETLDFYMRPHLTEGRMLVYYAGPAWKNNDESYLDQHEDTFIALTIKATSTLPRTYHWELHYKLKTCNSSDLCEGVTFKQSFDDFALRELPSHLQISRVGNHFRLMHRHDVNFGEVRFWKQDPLHNQLLFIPTSRTVFYIGGRPKDVRISSEFDTYGSFSGSFSLVLYNKELWTLWNVRDSSSSSFIPTSFSSNQYVIEDIEGDVLAFKGDGYLFVERIGDNIKSMLADSTSGRRARSEFKFQINPQSLEGLVLFMYEPDQHISMTLRYIDSMLVIFVESHGELYYERITDNRSPFEVTIAQIYDPSLKKFVIRVSLSVGVEKIFYLNSWFDDMSQTRAWFGGYVDSIARQELLRLDNSRSCSFLLNCSSFVEHFSGSVKMTLKPASSNHEMKIFNPAYYSFFRKYYINSKYQKGVARTDYTSAYAREVGLSQGYLEYQDLKTVELMNIVNAPTMTQYDSLSLSFRADSVQSGCIFYIADAMQSSQLKLLINNGALQVEISEGSSKVQLETRANPIIEDTWHQVFILLNYANGMFSLYFDNQLMDQRNIPAGWSVFVKNKGDITIPVMWLGSEPDQRMPTFSGCLRDFVVTNNPVDFFSKAVTSSNATYYQCPSSQYHTLLPNITLRYPIQLKEDECLSQVEQEASVGGFTVGTTLKFYNTIPFFEDFHLEFKISLLNLEMVDSSITSTHSASFFTHSHILSLKSKLGEIITLLATHDKCIFMAVKNSYNSSATLSATYCPDGNMNVRLSCKGMENIFSCSLNNHTSLMVARRQQFVPEWPVIFGSATALENALEDDLYSFVGCMDGLSVSGESAINRLRTGLPCYTTSTGYYFDGTAHVVTSFDNKLTWSLRAIRKNGLLAAVIHEVEEMEPEILFVVGLKLGKVLTSEQDGNLLSEDCSEIKNLSLTLHNKNLTVEVCTTGGCSNTLSQLSRTDNLKVYFGGLPLSDFENAQSIEKVYILRAVDSEGQAPNFVGLVLSSFPEGSVSRGINLGPVGLQP